MGSFHGVLGLLEGPKGGFHPNKGTTPLRRESGPSYNYRSDLLPAEGLPRYVCWYGSGVVQTKRDEEYKESVTFIWNCYCGSVRFSRPLRSGGTVPAFCRVYILVDSLDRKGWRRGF